MTYKVPTLVRIHVCKKRERGIDFALCGYFQTHDWVDEKTNEKHGLNDQVEVYEYFTKRWPHMRCEDCDVKIEEASNGVDRLSPETRESQKCA